jgi:excisionase family DNA binding protein
MAKGGSLTPPPLYGLKEACGALGISMRTMEGHIREGHVPVVRLGRLRKIRPADYERLVRDGLPPNGSRARSRR